MKRLTVEKQTLQNNAFHIKIKGYLDAYTYTQLESTIKEIFDLNVYRIVFDLQELEYISSAGASVFIGAQGIATENNGAIILVKPSKNVMQVLELLGLHNIFTIKDSKREALEILK